MVIGRREVHTSLQLGGSPPSDSGRKIPLAQYGGFMRSSMAVIIASLAAGGIMLAPTAAYAGTHTGDPARARHAQDSTDPDAPTTVTFTVTTGVLSISAPDTADLGATTLGGTAVVSGSLGLVTITDDRNVDPADWQASAESSDFDGTNNVDDTHVIGADNVTYATGDVTPANVTLTPAAPVDATVTFTAADTPIDLFAGAATGDNSASWSPTISIDTTGAFADAYTGTITNSVVSV